MLNKKYDSCFIGLNYISLINGIAKLKTGKSALIIDDAKYSFANQWFLNIGELEKGVLEEIGTQFEISALKEIQRYLKNENTILRLNETIIEFSDDYFLNLKELARKVPECLKDYFIHEIENLNKASFNQEMDILLDTIKRNSLHCKNPEELNTVFSMNQFYTFQLFEYFSDFLNTDDPLAKQLHFVLQMSFQNIFSNEVINLENRYLFLALLTKRYKIDNNQLMRDLKQEFTRLGGDLKATQISDWGIRDEHIHYVLLKSIDGVTEITDCYYYGQLNLQPKFEMRQEVNKFSSIIISYALDHPYTDYFRNKRVICNDDKKMGSDFPYWEFSLDHLGHLQAIYSYTDQLGTKASFYYNQALEDLYQSLVGIFPGLDRDHWFAAAELKNGLDSWYEYPGLQKMNLIPKSPKPVHQQYYFEDQKIKNLHFMGPERGQILGFYGYLIDLFSEV